MSPVLNFSVDHKNSGNNTFSEIHYMYEDYFYEGFKFERPIYKYIWIVLAFIITIQNITVCLVLNAWSRKTSTNVCLFSIAIFETAAILCTIPTYVEVYEKFEAGTNGAFDVYILSETLCDDFMLSKFFISKTFRLISIWIHCFVSFQRFVSVWKPFRAKLLFTFPRTMLVVFLMIASAPFVHLFQPTDDKSNHGLCQWDLEAGCKEACLYIWISSMLSNFIPCMFMLLMTTSMVIQLKKSSTFIQTTMRETNMEAMTSRVTENYQVSKIISAVVISLLIPEIPYGVFLIFCIIRRQKYQLLLPLRVNRALHAGYELLVGLSSISNFWIYFTLNKTFKASVLGFGTRLSRCWRNKRSKGSSRSRNLTAGSTTQEQSSRSGQVSNTVESVEIGSLLSDH